MSEPPANVLVLTGTAREASAFGCRLEEALASSPRLALEVSEDPRSLCRLAGRSVVVVTREEPLHPEQAEALAGFLHDGGRVLALGDTLWHWRAHPLLGAAAAWTAGRRTPATEVRVHPVDAGQVTARLPEEFRVTSPLRLLAGAPEGARTLLTVSWQLSSHVVAFSLRVGAGTLIHLGLDAGQLVENADARRLLTRCIRQASGHAQTEAVGVGLLGYGAIARAHAEAIRSVTGLTLCGVVDPSAQRREAAGAELDVATHATAAGLYDDPAVDLAVIGTPPNTHSACTLEALEAGRHVVCEKPLALTLRDADLMIERARDTGRVLTVYQNRRWDPDFVALLGQVRSGTVGSPFHLEAFVGGYGHPCGYWHSHEPVSGGTLFDWGSHYVDQILLLFGAPVVSVTAHAHKRIWHDVTNADQVQLTMSFEGGAEASFIHSDVAAARKPKWYLLGTQGAIVGNWQSPTLTERDWAGEVIENPLPPADAPARLVVHRPDGHGGVHEEALALAPRDRLGFYRNLADHLLTEEPLAVSHRDMRRVIGVLDAATQSIAQGGTRISVSL